MYTNSPCTSKVSKKIFLWGKTSPTKNNIWLLAAALLAAQHSVNKSQTQTYTLSAPKSNISAIIANTVHILFQPSKLIQYTFQPSKLIQYIFQLQQLIQCRLESSPLKKYRNFYRKINMKNIGRYRNFLGKHRINIGIFKAIAKEKRCK